MQQTHFSSGLFLSMTFYSWYDVLENKVQNLKLFLLVIILKCEL